MQKKQQRKTIYYKHVSIHGEKHDLQTLLQKVFDKGSSTHFAKARMEALSESSNVRRLINEIKDRERMFYGQMLMFEPGKPQGLLTLDDSVEHYSIDALTTDKIRLESEGGQSHGSEDKKIREFVDSFLYFSVIGNHLAVVQSRSLTSRELEAHLQWFLSDKAQVIGKDSAVILSDKPLEKTIKKLESRSAKKILLGAPVLTGEGVPLDIDSSGGSMARSVKFTPKGMGFDVLKGLMGEKWLDQQEFSEELDDANLKVKLEVTYSRKTSKEGQKVLDSIATSLRHTDSADVTIMLNGGGDIKGGELRLSGNVDFIYYDGVLDENLLYDNMFKWLRDKVSDGEIDLSDGNDPLI
ncbi:hypothetical protein ACT3UJ_02400 [Halomonas sp. 86]|uniref:hypothetical protein n=1 Tax=unclassified Halomonas TaxID=2609666 RepID=UPI004034E6BF